MDKLLKVLKNKVTIRVGILGSSKSRKEGSNAAIGAKHEFGLDGMPVRSFLRMPLTMQLSKNLEKSGAFDEDVIKQVMKDGSTIPWAQKVAVIAENTVQDAFDTGGFGQWKPSNMTHKKNHQTLVETAQLRESIISEIK